MITLPPNLKRQFADFYNKIKTGELRTFIPMLSLLKINGKPFTLQRHFFMAPLFDTVQPPQTLLMCGRQVAKSTTIAANSILRGFFIPHYHQLIISPQQDQVQRFNAAAVMPLLKSCPILPLFMSSAESNKLALKTFRNSSMIYLDYCGAGGNADPSRLRGIANIAQVCLDETNWENTPIYVLDKGLEIPKQVPIKAVKAGDFILSCNFCDGSATVSVVTKDASFHGYRNYFTVTTKTGRSLTCTADHVLPTNHGPMRIGDIIEYVYSRTSVGNRDDRRTSQCNHGQSFGGCISEKEREGNTGDSLESWTGARGLRDSQIQPLVRVRYTSSVRDRESRLRGLLGSLDFESSSDISLYVHPSPADGLREENSHCGIFERDYTSDSTGLVVHGRREQGPEQQLRDHLHKRLQRRGSQPSLSVAENALGSGCENHDGETQLDRKYRLCDSFESGGLYCIDEPDNALCTGVYGIQSQSEDKELSALRPGVHCTQSVGILLPGMQGSISDDTSTREVSEISRGASGGASGQGCRLSRSAQGRDTAEGQRVSCQHDTRAKSCKRCTDQSLADSQSQSCSREQAQLEETQERRSGVRSESESRACQILRTEETGPCSPCPYAGVAEAESSASRGQGTRSGLPKKAKSHEADQRPDACCTEKRDQELQKSVSCIEGRSGCPDCICFPISERSSGMPSGDDSGEFCCVGTVPADAEWVGDFFIDPIVNIEYAGVLPGYDIEVEGTHAYVLANGILSKNCQDIPYQYIPIIMEVSSASINWGFVTYAGTPKTTDTTLALLWNRSSQAEWVIRCTHCGYFNVPNPEQDLLKMIGSHYPICTKCGGRIWPENGGWIHAKPDLAMTFRSLHLPQVIHPLHSINEIKWAKLLDKVNNYSEVALYNEVFGWPYDAATSPLTMSDLISAQYDPMDAYGNVIDIKTPEDVQKVADAYSYVTVGCDFSGGGPISDSYTAFAVLGLRRDNQVVDILYGERLPKGISPTEEARILLRWIEGSKADAFAFDNGGSGFVRLEMMKQMGLMSIPGLTICPETYVGPRGGDIMKLSPAQREPDLKFYTVDKSRSLAMCIAGIKAKRIRCRRFNPEDEDAYIRDFLALIEDPRESRGKETVILISKKISVPDDFSHAVNFGCCQIFDRFGAYIPIGSKYDATRLLFDENHKPIIPDEVFGPRGDFDRFVAGCNEAVSIVEPDDDYF